MNHSQRYLTLPGELFLFSGSCLEFSNPSLHLFQPGTGTGQYLLLNLKFLAGHQLQPIKGAAQCRVQVSTHLLCESLWQQARNLFGNLINQSGGCHGVIKRIDVNPGEYTARIVWRRLVAQIRCEAGKPAFHFGALLLLAGSRAFLTI